MCVFHNEDYIKLLDLLIFSIAHNSDGITDVLIMTSPDFLRIIQNKLHNNMYKFHIYYMTQQFTSLFEAGCARLHIFDYEHINKYNKILYLDTDVLVRGNFNTLFNTEIAHNKIHALEEGNIGHVWWGGQFFDFSNNYTPDMSGFSSGVMYFYNSQEIKHLFVVIKNHIKNYMNSGMHHPDCLDQPFIIYNSYMRGMADTQLMKQFLKNNADSISSTNMIYHFPGGVGHYQSKYHKMISFLHKIIRAE